MAGVLLTINGKLITNPKDGMEYDFYIPDLEDPRSLDGRDNIQGVSAKQLYTSGVSTVDVVSRTIAGSLRVNLSQGGTYNFSAISHEQRSTPSFDVKYGTYAGYTVIGENIFRRGLLTSPEL